MKHTVIRVQIIGLYDPNDHGKRKYFQIHLKIMFSKNLNHKQKWWYNWQLISKYLEDIFSNIYDFLNDTCFIFYPECYHPISLSIYLSNLIYLSIYLSIYLYIYIYIRNSSGPKTEPCATPWVLIKAFDSASFIYVLFSVG